MPKIVLKETAYGKRGLRFIDIIGQKFERLSVISFIGINKNKKAEWLCQCECGNTKIVEGKMLRDGTIKSCGCLWVESISLPKGEASFNHFYLEYELGAKKRGIEFNLSKDEFKLLTSRVCYYCGSEPIERNSSNSVNGKYVGNGIDRVENKAGYVISNCVSCCKSCNVAKATMSKYEFLDLIRKIYRNMGLQ